MPTTTQRTIALENLRKEIEKFEEEQSLKLLFDEDPLDIYDLLFEDDGTKNFRLDVLSFAVPNTATAIPGRSSKKI